MGYELRAGQRATGYEDRPSLQSGAEEDGEGLGFADRIGIARLFGAKAAEPPEEADPYADDFDEETPRIVHKAGSHRAASTAQTAVLFFGGLTASTLLFSAGFLAAVLVFGEPTEGDGIAIRTGNEGLSQTAASQGPAFAQAPTADGRQIVPPPVPDISQVEARSEAAFGTPSSTASVSPAPSPPQTVQAQPLPAPSVTATSPVTAPTTVAEAQPTGADFTTESDVSPPVAAPTANPAAAAIQAQPAASVPAVPYPTAKPSVPPRPALAAAPPSPPAQSPAPLTLGPPGGQYSLQFGAFRDRANAEGLVRELSPRVQAQIIETPSAGGVPLFYVRGGAFDSRNAALTAVRDLRRDLGVVTFVYANRVTG